MSDFLAKKSLGQNFLKNINILEKIVDEGEINSNDILLEIGPGTGNLTNLLIQKKPKKLIIVEKDKQLSAKLKDKFGSKVRLINDDILNCYNNFICDKPIKVFGNLPYNISTKILINYLKVENLNKFYEKFIFIFQKEVADRIIAEENTKYFGRLAIFTSWKLHKEKIFDIAPENFNPIPKIWSSLIALKPKDEIFKINRADNLEYITNTFFSQRRKMINKPFKKIFQNQSSICEKIGLNLKDRPQNISVQKYLEITKIYEELT